MAPQDVSSRLDSQMRPERILKINSYEWAVNNKSHYCNSGEPPGPGRSSARVLIVSFSALNPTRQTHPECGRQQLKWLKQSVRHQMNGPYPDVILLQQQKQKHIEDGQRESRQAQEANSRIGNRH